MRIHLQIGHRPLRLPLPKSLDRRRHKQPVNPELAAPSRLRPSTHLEPVARLTTKRHQNRPKQVEVETKHSSSEWATPTRNDLVIYLHLKVVNTLVSDPHQNQNHRMDHQVIQATICRLTPPRPFKNYSPTP